MRSSAALAFVCLTVAAGCGRQSLTASPDAETTRVPSNHRASGLFCPAGRGPGSTTASYCATDGGSTTAAITGPRLCAADSDCTAGSNGRCFLNGGPVADCGTSCSYDGCAQDTDCPNDEPCVCRASAADSAANICLTGGNCRVDSDCGAGGYCSPSQVNDFCFCPSPALCPDGSTLCSAGDQQVPCACGDACGHAYFCHTKRDSCTDDSDCPGGQTCNFDTVNGIWDCATCWAIP
ncbi:MAG TPA: hypothetical protein VHG72_17805 [Polyangia bacterium]|nr:hypothetical protein [Polyangia bacterium]